MTCRLYIPLSNRIAGVIFFFVFIVLGLFFLFLPEGSRFSFQDIDNELVGLSFLVGTSICTPSIFYPCMFDSFPKFIRDIPLLEAGCRRLLVR
jgi:hypothetical protein